MSVRYGGGDTWYMRISNGRKNKATNFIFHGTEAEAFALDRQAKGKPVQAGSRIGDLVPGYLLWYKINQLPGSYNELNYALKRLLPHFGELPAMFLTSIHLEQYKAARLLDTWQGRPTAKITINRELKHLMALLHWAIEQGTINALTLKPLYFTARHCEEEERPVNALTPLEIRDFLTVLVGRPTWLLFVLMFWTGIRKKEVCNLKAGDLDLNRRVFRLKGKGGTVSNEPIPESLVEKLTIAIKGKKPVDWLCPNPLTGEPYTDLRTPLETACKRAGITKRFHPHACRHSFATIMDAGGASLVEIQMRLRHADIQTTRKYVKRLGQGNFTDWMGVSMSGEKVVH